MNTSADMLPELRSNRNIVKTKPLPTSLQSDFIPEDILLALTVLPDSKEKLRPPSRGRSLNAVSCVSRPPPASVWNYKRRNHIKHLLDHTPCICGAGKDISFLYDVPHSVPQAPKPDLLDQSCVRKENEVNCCKPLILPDSVIPEAYHIVKNRGVLGIDCIEDKYGTQPLDHEKHLVLFPSMNPTSRYEVIQLKNTFERMIEKAGINNTESFNGPTQMHNLLELIKKEQNIYNIVFNELIRQITVECAERGELLHLIWNKYHQLLSRVPEEIMSLHEEVISQRALDLRLTDELMKFKGTIETLTSELTDVKEHDRKVTKEAQKAQEDLRSALAESQKNASVLAEYHDLYELQRHRLEKQMSMLSVEKEMWSSAAYSLAVKVTQEYKLNTAKCLQLLEKSWAKLASHFTILLSDRDTDLLTKIQGHVEKWRDQLEEFSNSLTQREDKMRENIKAVRDGVENYVNIFKKKYFEPDRGVVKVLDEDFIKSLTSNIKSWLESVVTEVDTFGGITLLNNQEKLTKMGEEMEGWTESALKMFERHYCVDSGVHPYQITLLALNKEIKHLLKQLHDRTMGENGLARILINCQSSLETWDARFMSNAQGMLIFREFEWGTFYHILEDWLLQLDVAIKHIGVDMARNGNGMSVQSFSSYINEVIRKTQNWATEASHSIDSEDAKLVEQVSSLHSEMIKWMIQILLHLAPDKDGISQESVERALLSSISVPQLTETANKLFKSLETFSNHVALCCEGIVRENTLKRQDTNREDAEYELKDLQRLKAESTKWIQTAQILLSELTDSSVEPQRKSAVISDKSVDLQQVVEKEGLQRIAKEEMMNSVQNSNLSPPTVEITEISSLSKCKMGDDGMIEVLGIDANMHTQTIEGIYIQEPENIGVAESQDAKNGFKALAAVETIQNQLIETEKRAQLAEERASQAESEIIILQERVRALEKQLMKQQKQVLY